MNDSLGYCNVCSHPRQIVYCSLNWCDTEEVNVAYRLVNNTKTDCQFTCQPHSLYTLDVNYHRHYITVFIKPSLNHCLHQTLTVSLSSSNPHNVTVFIKPSLHHCLHQTLTTSLSSSNPHYTTVFIKPSLHHCLHQTLTTSLFEQYVIYAELMDQYGQFLEDTSNHQHGVMLSNVATRYNKITRYMILYVLKLLNIDLNHPGARPLLVNGALSIKCTTKSFTRCAVDLTLESTINAEAASHSTGITAFTQSEEARHCKMVTQSARSVITGQLFDMSDLKKNEDSSQQLSKHLIKRDNEDLDKVKNYMEETFYPFDGRSQDTNLSCLTTGKAASI